LSNCSPFVDHSVCFSGMKNDHALVLGSNPRWIASCALGVC
jgi:hypothetical protein